jgi:hypothetical protein
MDFRLSCLMQPEQATEETTSKLKTAVTMMVCCASSCLVFLDVSSVVSDLERDFNYLDWRTLLSAPPGPQMC